MPTKLDAEIKKIKENGDNIFAALVRANQLADKLISDRNALLSASKSALKLIERFMSDSLCADVKNELFEAIRQTES